MEDDVPLKERINEDIKTAMKSGDKLRLETIRSIRALILEFEKSGTGKELNQDEEIRIVNSAVKKRKDAIEQYQNAGREDLRVKEETELKILLEYLPKQLSQEEIEEEVRKLAAETGAHNKSDFPKLMPAVIKSLKGKADGKTIKTAVEKFLGIN
jgi:uncharacterized protein